MFKNNLTVFKDKHSALEIPWDNVFKWFHKDLSAKFIFSLCSSIIALFSSVLGMNADKKRLEIANGFFGWQYAVRRID